MNDNWISVKDRLPASLGNKVLVSCISESTNDYVGFGHYEKHKGKETWFNLETGESFENTLAAVAESSKRSDYEEHYKWIFLSGKMWKNLSVCS